MSPARAPSDDDAVRSDGNERRRQRVIGDRDVRRPTISDRDAITARCTVGSAGRNPASAVAAEPTTCIAFTADAIRAAVAAEPALAWVFITRLGNRIRVLVERVDAQAARRLPERLAALILERHQEAGGGAFGLGGSQTAVAEELGTVREVVVRMLGELRRAGLIRPAGRGRLEVANLTELRRLAGAAPQRATGSAMR